VRCGEWAGGCECPWRYRPTGSCQLLVVSTLADTRTNGTDPDPSNTSSSPGATGTGTVPSDAPKSGGVSLAGAIAGGVVAGVVVFAALFAGWFLYRRRQKK
jgi:hypothetical protein